MPENQQTGKRTMTFFGKYIGLFVTAVVSSAIFAALIVGLISPSRHNSTDLVPHDIVYLLVAICTAFGAAVFYVLAALFLIRIRKNQSRSEPADVAELACVTTLVVAVIAAIIIGMIDRNDVR